MEERLVRWVGRNGGSRALRQFVVVEGMRGGKFNGNARKRWTFEFENNGKSALDTDIEIIGKKSPINRKQKVVIRIALLFKIVLFCCRHGTGMGTVDREMFTETHTMSLYSDLFDILGSNCEEGTPLLAWRRMMKDLEDGFDSTHSLAFRDLEIVQPSRRALGIGESFWANTRKLGFNDGILHGESLVILKRRTAF